LVPMARDYFRQSEGRTDFYQADLSKHGHVVGMTMMQEAYGRSVPLPYYDRRKDPAQAGAFDADGNLLPGH
ncbi:MAG: hypothetical protein KDB23_32485, partial [Planctomycetales bacterium]|nr:hypothetical protein [Planctomycetales bacterium]